MGPHETPWDPMGPHGTPWEPMGTHGNPWDPMGPHGTPWILDFRGGRGSGRQKPRLDAKAESPGCLKVPGTRFQVPGVTEEEKTAYHAVLSGGGETKTA